MRVTWIDQGRQTTVPSNPMHPKGVDIDLTDGRQWHCSVPLPYPAKGVGMHLLDCDLCELRIAITASGRADDPRTVKVPCRHRTPRSRL